MRLPRDLQLILDLANGRFDRTHRFERAQAHVRNDHLGGLRAVTDLAGLKRRILISMSDEKGRTPDGIELMSLPAFTDELERGTLLR